MRNPRTAVLVVALAAMLLPSCLEFERQTILMRRDTATDTLLVRIIYEGIYSTAEPEKLDSDFETLAAYAKPGHGFVIMDPLFSFELDAPKGAGAALLALHAKITNGAFFMNAEKKLSAWQDLRIEKATAFIAAVNSLAGDEVGSGRASPDSADPATLKLLADAAAKKHAWFTLDSAGLRFDFFASPADAEKMKAAFMRDFAGDAIEAAAGDIAEARSKPGALLRTLSRNPISWTHRGTALSVAVAPDAAAPEVVRLEWWNESRYVANLLEAPKGGKKPPKLPAKLDGGATVAKLSADFAKLKPTAK
jgi:hypothetical protein